MTENGFSRLAKSFNERIWDPSALDQRGVGDVFQYQRDPIMPQAWFPELRTPIFGDLTDNQRDRLGNEIICWLLSGILEGERTAAKLFGQLASTLSVPSIRRCAINQQLEEERHDLAFASYLKARCGTPYSAGDLFGGFLRGLLMTNKLHFKIVGMSLIVESFAMGALSNIRAHTLDPALSRMLTLVLRDEAAHHSFGTLWLEQSRLSESKTDWAALQRFALKGFEILRVNLLSIGQRRKVYAIVGADWRSVRRAVQEHRRTTEHGVGLEESINPLQLVAANLDRAGLIADQDRERFAIWLT